MEMQSRIVIVHPPWSDNTLDDFPSADAPKPPKKRFLEEAAGTSGSAQDENEEPLDLSGEFFIRARQQDLINRLVEKFCRKPEEKESKDQVEASNETNWKVTDLPLKKRSIAKGKKLLEWKSPSAAQKDRSGTKYLEFVNRGITKKKINNCSLRS